MAKQEASSQTSGVNATPDALDEDFLNQFAGQKQSEIPQEALSVAFLSITNSLSDAVANKQAEEGVFFNSGTGHALGAEVRVVPVAYKTVWDEKDRAGKTLMRYEPKGIPVNLVPPPPGKPGYPTMINPDTGNQIVETFAYALVLPDDPGAGFVMLTAGLGSMKIFRRWNTMMSQVRLPNGDPAPIHLRTWRLIAGSRISKTTGKAFYGLDNIVDEGWVKRDLHQALILPARDRSHQFLLAAPTGDSTDAEAAE